MNHPVSVSDDIHNSKDIKKWTKYHSKITNNYFIYFLNQVQNLSFQIVSPDMYFQYKIIFIDFLSGIYLLLIALEVLFHLTWNKFFWKA